MDEKQSTPPNAPPGCFICQTVMPMIENLCPPDTRAHFRNSRVEFLKGIRSLIDQRIEHRSHEEPKGQRVTVE